MIHHNTSNMETFPFSDSQFKRLQYLHALAFICSIRGAQIQAHVDDYYSIEKFRAAYAGSVPSTTYSLDKAQLVESQLRLQSTPTNSKKASRQNQEAEN